MTYDTFIRLLQELRPGAVAHPHGAFATQTDSGRRHTQTVGITFTPGGKVYEYRGTYTDVLVKLGGGPKWTVFSEACWAGAHWTEEEAKEACEKAQKESDALTAAWGGPKQTYAVHFAK